VGVNSFIQIGNSDDRLTQRQWAKFVGDMRTLLTVAWRGRLQVHGEWFSGPDQPWQNANWCVEILPPDWWVRIHEAPLTPEEQAYPEIRARNRKVAAQSRDHEMQTRRDQLKGETRDLCRRYSQDSYAWTSGTVELVETGWLEEMEQRKLEAIKLFQATPRIRRLKLTEDEAKAFLARENDRQVLQAQAEGWLPPTEREIEEGTRSPYLNDADRQRIHGEAEGSTPSTPAPASTGEGEEPEHWAGRGHDHAEGISCPIPACIHNDAFGKVID